MDLTAPLSQSTPAPDAAPSPELRPLRRSGMRRMLAGVAGGIAERFEVDVNIVRVAFVVLICVWGLGAATYLAMWALVPKVDDGAFVQVAEGEVAEVAESAHGSLLCAHAQIRP